MYLLRFRALIPIVLLFAVLAALPSVQAASISITEADKKLYGCLDCGVSGALSLLYTAKSVAFFGADPYVDPTTGKKGYNPWLAGGPTIQVTDLPGNFGLYHWGDNVIKIDKSLVEKCCQDGPNRDKARQLLEITIAHEFVHWVDFHDNGVQDWGATEEGALWETAVFGKVMNWSNATGDYLCPEPATWLSLAAGLLFMSRLRRRRV